MTVRPIGAADAEAVLDMMRTLYRSTAFLTDGSEAILQTNLDRCARGDPYVEGYVLEHGEALLGYVMLARSYSTEFGKPCLWVEDLFVREAFRGQGHGERLLRSLFLRYPDALFLLEVEPQNERAQALYRRCGFEAFPYAEMIRFPNAADGGRSGAKDDR